MSLGVEFNFFDFNLHEIKTKFTPYIHSGISYFRHHNAYRKVNIVVLDEEIGSFAIPMTLGIKSNVSRHIVLGLEVGARYTFTDNLEGSNPKEGTLMRFGATRFGNINNNDWYVFSGFTLSYTFGRKPCYCAQ